MAVMSTTSRTTLFRVLTRARARARATLGSLRRYYCSSEAASSVELVKEYQGYMRSLYGEITHKAFLVDAVGTLLIPSQPIAQIYRKIGEKYGVEFSEAENLNRYRRAYEKPWGRTRLRVDFVARWIGNSRQDEIYKRLKKK